MRPVSLLFHDVYERDPRESGFASDAADRYKLSLADFDRQLQHLARCDASSFALTFDDGGVSFYTHVADRLEALGLRAHLFMTTDYIAHRGFLDVAQLRDLDARGFVIGSHSASHPARFSTIGDDRMRREWTESRKVLEDVLGHAVTTASVPGGYFSTAVARAADAAGVRTLYTSEPSRAVQSEGACAVIGRFTMRRGHAPDIASRFVQRAPWTRWSAWTTWNAKALVKPVLGASYMRIADWLLASREHA
jgi:peptidoglycan/xylan/chitin deacetylase (PgdA/CDA1 family)